MSIKSQARKLLWRLLERRADQPDEQFWSQRAVVFAPHQDDETLGCGGTIIAKKAMDATVVVVFLTDGRNSHAGLLAEDELMILRTAEAVAACRALGVGEEDVYFLEFEDGRLTEQVSTAVEKIVELLAHVQPEQVFIPYRKEPPPDHYSTQQAVLTALQTYGQPVQVYEYPVWFWYHWPWVSFLKDPLGDGRAIFKNTLTMLFGLRLVTDFNFIVNINTALARKHAALAEHKSQMAQLIPDTHWLTLADVSNGDWLACFFQKQEVFRHYLFPDNGPIVNSLDMPQSDATPFDKVEKREK